MTGPPRRLPVPPVSEAGVGLAWVGLAGIFFVVFVVIVRYLGGALHPLQTAFIRYAFGLLILAPALLRYGPRLFHTRHLGRHAARGVVHAVGVMLWFFAVTQLPLAEVTALSFTAPIYVALGAALLLGERWSTARIGAILAGLAGVLLILRPGWVPLGWGAAAMLAAAPLFAASKLLTKVLVRDDSSVTVVAQLSVFATITMLVPALSVWQTPTLRELAWIAATALFATLSHLCMSRGLRTVDVTVAQPVEFLQLVWAALLGLVLFGERPSLWVWSGAVVIVASVSFIALREKAA